jgi:steroid delta-isomerase-like uncharacterized protein
MMYATIDRFIVRAAEQIWSRRLALGATTVLLGMSLWLQADAVSLGSTSPSASQGAAVLDARNPTPIGHEDIERWAAAWNSHNIDTVLALFDPQVAINQPSNPKPLNLEGARGFFTMIFRAYPDFHVAVTDAVVEGQTGVSVERVTGTWLGPFVDPATGKATPGNGRAFDHPGVMILKYGVDHKIKHVDIYWDRVLVNQQLGIAS